MTNLIILCPDVMGRHFGLFAVENDVLQSLQELTNFGGVKRFDIDLIKDDNNDEPTDSGKIVKYLNNEVFSCPMEQIYVDDALTLKILQS